MNDRGRRATATAAVASLLLLTWNGVAGANPPATWDFDEVNRENLVENVDWQIMGEHQSAYDVPGGTHTYCTGVVRWRTQAWTGSTMSPGDLYGVFAVEKPTQMTGNCAGVGGVGGFRKWVSDHAGLYGLDKRPAVLFLHGNQAHASFRLAAWVAYNLRNDEEKYRPFVIAINAPGQGIVCDCPVGFFSPPECKTWCGDQRSVGQGMDPPTSWVEGFSGYGNPVYPEHHILWGSVLNAAATTNVIKRVFAGAPEPDGTGGLGFVNDFLVVGGFSAGGVASLLFNTQDDRPDAVFAWSASGGWDQGLKQPGSTMAWLLTVPSYTTPFDPFYSIDCPAVRLQPSSYPVAKQKACQVVDYFDPVNFTGD